MKSIIFFLLLIVTVNRGTTQSYFPSWAVLNYNYGYSEHKKTIIDHNNNIIVWGTFEDSTDFDPTSDSFYLNALNYYGDYFIQKLDENGHLVWVKQFPIKEDGVFQVQFWDMAVDSNNDLLFTGIIFNNSTYDFDPDAGSYFLSTPFEGQTFVLKISENGQFLWVKTFENTTSINNTNYGSSIYVSADNTIIIGGGYLGTVDFDPGSGVNTLSIAGIYARPYFVKLTNDGEFVWAKDIQSVTGNVSLEGVYADFNNNIYLKGYFFNTADFDPGLSSYNLSSMAGPSQFVLKLNSSGHFIWAKHWVGSSQEYISSLKVDSSENIYLSGYFDGMMDLDPDAGEVYHTSPGGLYVSNSFLIKLNSSGQYVNGYVWGDLGDQFFNDMTLRNDRLFIACHFEDDSALDVDPSTNQIFANQPGEAGFVILVLDTNLNYNNHHTFIFNRDEFYVNNILTSPSDDWIYISGFSSDSCEYILNNTINTLYAFYVDVFALKLKACNINTQLNISSSSLEAVSSGLQYQWIDCVSGLPMMGENNQTFTPLSNGSYAVILSNSYCIDTSACFTINHLELKDTDTNYSISIYPNPTTDNIFINASASLTKVDIANVLGAVMVSLNNLNSNSLTFSFNNYPPGIYMITINNTNTYKIIKQ